MIRFIRLKPFNSKIRKTYVPNAFWMSIKVIPVIKPFSKHFKILPFKSVSVEWFFLKSD